MTRTRKILEQAILGLLKPRVRSTTVGLLIAGGLFSTTAIANPDSPVIIAGSAEFREMAGQLTITNSPGAIINWNGFSIDRNELTRFLQQNEQSAVLNRVTGSGISNILGELLSNGRVFLVNPNGIVIGNDARIDTAGFVGSSLDIKDDDFLSGRYQFKGDGGAVVNNGAITSGPGGEVILIAPSVENNGDISVTDGEIILAAGREVTLTSLNDANISFRVSAPGDKAMNIGSMTAVGGAIGVFANQVMSSGSISANRISTNSRGQIVLQADGSTEVSGTITAIGNDVPAGDITILGDNIALTSAQIDATGTNGGRVLVGGEFQGNGDLQRANRTEIDQNSVIHADALERGNGGEIIVWSEQSTNSQGRLTARGGSISGDGGMVETSSRGNLQFGQPADVSAASGNPGTWLLDPEDIVIDSAHADSISTALNGGSNVQVKTADTGTGEGNITVNAPIRKTEGRNAALGLTAHNRIDVNAPIESTSGKLKVSLKAGRDIKVNASIKTNGGRYSANIVPSLLPLEPKTESEEKSEAPAASELPESAESAESADADPETIAESPEVPTEENSVEALPVETASIEENVDVIPLNENGISIEATVSTDGGDIDIDAGEQGMLSVNSVITANGDTAGDIQLLGDQIALFESASVESSSVAGGGEILIGGDQQGLNPDIPNSEAVYIASTASVSANGIGDADGGRIIVYAKDTANIKSDLSAKGGDAGGDGGFIETSGRQSLRVDKTPDASAANGEAGNWLIDPDTISIVDSDNDISIDPTSNGSTDIFTSTADDALLGVETVINALAAGTNVEVVTADNSNGSGDINLNADINLNNRVLTGQTAGGLSLRAHNDINIRGSIDDSASFSGDERIAFLVLEANSDDMNGGGVTIDATGHSMISPSISENDIEINVIGDVTISGEFLTVTAGNNDDFEAVRLESGGALNLDIAGDIEVINNGSSADALVRSNGTGSMISAQNLILTGTDNSGNSRFGISSSPQANQGSLNIADTITLDGGQISGNGDINTDNLIWNEGDIFSGTGTLTTTGDVTIDIPGFSGTIGKDWNIDTNSVVNWNDGRIMLAATINNNGTFLANADDTVFTDGDTGTPGTFNNNATGEFRKTASTCNPDCGETEFLGSFGAPIFFNNSGLVRVEEGDLKVNQARNAQTGQEIGGFTQLAGRTELAGGNLVSEIPVNTTGIPDPGELNFIGGTLEGGTNDGVSEGGQVIGNTVVSGGTIAAGFSPGTLTFNGDLTVNDTSGFTIELDGTNTGEFDVINVTGTATLNNPTVNVEFLGYTPPDTTGIQDFFDVITAQSLTINPDATALTVNQPAALPANVIPSSGQAGETFFLSYLFDDTFVPTMEPEPMVPETPEIPTTDPESPRGIVRIFDIPDSVRIPRTGFMPQPEEMEMEIQPLFDPINPVITLLQQNLNLEEEKDDGPNFLQCY